MHFDVFNGDADGIIALLQLRLSQKIKQPKDSILITGVKRDISLLKQVDIEKALSVTVLDISLEKNIESLTHLLAKSIDVFYVDHHRTGVIPQSKKLTSLLNTDANICTSLLVNEYLEGEFAYWAIAAAYGDNMHASARQLAEKLKLSHKQQAQLCELGTYINYNGYGSNVDDLHYHPADLYQKISVYSNPFELINEKGSIFEQLKTCYLQDMKKAENAEIIKDDMNLKVVLLEDAAWARRVSGVFGNDLANKYVNKAHVILTLNTHETYLDKTYTVSLRAPLNNKQGAGDICSKFPTGGGRAAAAGINRLPEKMLGDLYRCVSEYYKIKD